MTHALTIDLAHIDRAVIRLTLERLGVSVTETTSPDDAIGRVRLDEPEIVFVDTSLSVLGGGELVSTLREACAQTRIVAITSFADGDVRARLRHAGAAAVLERPLTPARVRYAAALAAPVPQHHAAAA